MRVTSLNNTSIFPKVISVPFPTQKFNSLINELGFESKKEDLGSEEYKKIFVNAIHLFLKGGWSQDELSSLANDLWGTKVEKFDEFGSALYECAEMVFYVRNIYQINSFNPGFYGNFNQFMVTTIKFYEDNLNLINEEQVPT